MVDEDDERAEPLRDLLDDVAELLGLLVGKPGRRLVEQDDARACRRRRARPRRAAARAAPSAADLRLRRHVEADELDRARARRLAATRAWRRSARGSSRRCRRPTASRSPSRSGTSAAAPSAPAGSRPSRAGSRRTPRSTPARGLDEAAEDVEERRLAGAVRADQAAGAAGEDDAHVVDRRDAGEADGEALRPRSRRLPLRRPPASRTRSRRAARACARSFGSCSTRPPGAVSSTCRRPTPKRIRSEVRVQPPLRLEEERHELLEDAGDDRAPEAEDAADQRRRGERERVLRLERDRARHAHLRCEQAAGDAGDERRERERPELVERDVDAGGERRRLALADRRPGAARLAGDVQRARAGTGARRRRRCSGSTRRPPVAIDGRRTGGVLVVSAPVADRPLKPPPPFGKSVTDEDDRSSRPRTSA